MSRGAARSRRRRVVTLAASVLLLALAALPAAASAGVPPVTGLQALEGAVWHAESKFVIDWNPNPAGSPDVVYFQLYGPGGEKAAALGSDYSRYNGTTLYVPPVPGIYRFEAWNVDTNTNTAGPSVSVPLYFDNARPAAVSIAAPAWTAAGGQVQVHLSHPPAPLPISGIRGYAFALTQAPDGSPCARADRCTAAEIDLPGGIGADTATVPAPAEGISYLHAVAVSGAGLASPTTTLPIGVDGTAPQVHLDGAPSGWADGPVRLTAVAADRLSGMAPAGPSGPATALGIDGAPVALTPGASGTATVAGEGTHQVVYWARDAVGNAGDGSLPFAHPGTTTVRIDETDPSVRFAAGDPTDPERIEAIVADALSGPDDRRGSIALRPAGGSGAFEPLPTTVARGRLVARWDSDDFPHGPYEFRATGYDAAGNSATNRVPLVLHNPVKREVRVAFGFGAAALVYPRCARTAGSRRCRRAVVRSIGRRPTTRTVPCCHGAVVGGRLVDPTGAPLAGQRIDVVETFAPGAGARVRRTPLTTDAQGWFHTRLAPGPSRVVGAEFAGTHRLTRAAGRSLRLRVRAAVRLRVSTSKARVGGAPVVFSGRIVHPGARIPTRGLAVEFEFRLPGMAWTEFRTVQSDAAGRFAYPYSFSDDDSAGVRFLFRAFVPATGDWPFAPATSRPLAVIG